jgi:hypothetical protein
VEDVGGAGLGIENDHSSDTGIQILLDLLVDLSPTIIGRANLDDKVGGDGEIALGERASGHALIAVKGHIRPSHRVGVAPRDNAGTIANMAEIVIIEITSYSAANMAANLSMPPARDWSGNDLPPLKLLGIARIGSTSEFLGGQ